MITWIKVTTWTKGDATFELSEDGKILTVYMPPEKYWPTWNEYKKRPGDDTSEDDRKIAETCLDMIAEECWRLNQDGKQFELRLATVHMGALAVDRTNKP